jgi:membrane protein implicated in regulation of membrane protease activity
LKLPDVLILSFALALVIIGIHLSLTQGVEVSYPVFMFAVALLFWFQYRRTNNPKETQSPKQNTKKKKKH